MSLAGVIAVDLAGFLLLLWVLNLVRLGRLYVGYGVILVLVVAAVLTVLSFSPLRGAVSALLTASFPSSVVAGGALVAGFFLVMLVYVLSQLTVLSNRLATVVQELALEKATRRRGNGELPPVDDARD